MTTISNNEKKIRPPIVVVMGHIDHGKTKILDWIRQTKVVESESGGITQHIGAYEVEHKGKKITFIDTPGHEAFSKMRGRGAKVADVAVLVVAGDEGVKPQTKEALKIIQENEVPFVVAVNKSDKAEFNAERVKQELATENVLVESYGGSVPIVEMSAKTGQNMDSLLEMILLLAEMEDLKTDPEKLAEGVVIESHMDSRRGITTTLLILNGVLKKSDWLVIGRSLESIKIFGDFRGQQIQEAQASSPVILVGLSSAPAVGEKFWTFSNKKSAEEFLDKSSVEPPKTSSPVPNTTPSEKLTFNIILKADVSGSVEVLEESLRMLASDETNINILRSGIGNINETDVKLATATRLVTIVGFKVKTESAVKEMAEKTNVKIVTGDIIYELLDNVKEGLADLLPPVVNRLDIGRLKILKCFKKDGAKQIVGGRVEEGKIEKGAYVEIKRGTAVVDRGKINQLQKDKIDIDSVQKGFECGMMVESKGEIKEGDMLLVFYEELTKRKL
ncbi:MAG: translation initiation factor IF-2 [bacterium]|nr:translation initiation factor IF-2 [bacterium]